MYIMINIREYQMGEREKKTKESSKRHGQGEKTHSKDGYRGRDIQ